MRFPTVAILTIYIFSTSGCATIMNGSTQAINVKTTPPGAICDVGYKKPPIVPTHWSTELKEWVLSHLDTESLASIATPGIVVLKRDNDYSVNCRLKGYKDTVGQINHAIVSWDYLTVGNLAFGLIPGVIADLTTGAANRLAPAILDIQMTPPSLPEYITPPTAGKP
jgi:hypothetical protein